MLHLKLISIIPLMALGLISEQKTSATISSPYETKLIAVVNQASWCNVCKANGERFSTTIQPYASKGVAIIMNDLTNETTREKSKADLKKSAIYKTVYKTNRKGVGRMMQACGLVHGKNKSMVSGIVTFIDPKTLKVLSETSIAITDQEMKNYN